MNDNIERVAKYGARLRQLRERRATLEVRVCVFVCACGRQRQRQRWQQQFC